MSTPHRSSLPGFLPLLASILLLFMPNQGAGQAQAQLEGVVRERGGEVIVSASVALYQIGSEVPFRGTLTDAQGAYTLSSLPAGSYEIRVTRLGYLPSVRTLELTPGTRRLDVLLDPSAVEVQGVSVEAERSRERQRFQESAGVTVQELSGAQLRRIPGVAEMDPLRAMAVLPGVVSTSDFASSFNVRGGSADQNLILLDGIPIYNPFHLGGFFSVFNGAIWLERAEIQDRWFPCRQVAALCRRYLRWNGPRTVRKFQFGSREMSLLTTLLIAVGGGAHAWTERNASGPLDRCGLRRGLRPEVYLTCAGAGLRPSSYALSITRDRGDVVGGSGAGSN